MTEADKINVIIESLKANALGDIKRASNEGSKMGAFILCSCLIDAMAGFVKGADTTRTDYMIFISNYLTKYDPNSLYTDLRCKLVHTGRAASQPPTSLIILYRVETRPLLTIPWSFSASRKRRMRCRSSLGWRGDVNCNVS